MSRDIKDTRAPAQPGAEAHQASVTESVQCQGRPLLVVVFVFRVFLPQMRGGRFAASPSGDLQRRLQPGSARPRREAAVGPAAPTRSQGPAGTPPTGPAERPVPSSVSAQLCQGPDLSVKGLFLSEPRALGTCPNPTTEWMLWSTEMVFSLNKQIKNSLEVGSKIPARS